MAVTLNANSSTGFIATSDTSGVLQLQTGGTTAVTVDAAQNVGVGVTPAAWALSGASALQIRNAGFVGYLNSAYMTANTYFDSVGGARYIASANASYYVQTSGQHQWFTAASGTAGAAISLTQAMTLDASGLLGLGVTSPSSYSSLGNRLVVGDGAGNEGITIATGTGDNGSLLFADGTSGSAAFAGYLQYDHSDNSMKFGTNGSERARITSGGNLLVGRTSVNDFVAGATIYPAGVITLAHDGRPLYIDRLTTDGTLVDFAQANTVEGTISVSGTTVSYNGGHLSRYAQTQGAKDESLVKGTVLSNLDEMNVYVDADGNPVDNEQLNKVKVSDVEGDANVAGVFVNWTHDEQHNVDEINMAMTGDMIIRIAQGVAVARGDLLMSAGDGTAKPQGDDIVRSKTVAKVTSTHVTCTYADGSYCVPCVLMAC